MDHGCYSIVKCSSIDRKQKIMSTATVAFKRMIQSKWIPRIYGVKLRGSFNLSTRTMKTMPDTIGAPTLFASLPCNYQFNRFYCRELAQLPGFKGITDSFELGRPSLLLCDGWDRSYSTGISQHGQTRTEKTIFRRSGLPFFDICQVRRGIPIKPEAHLHVNHKEKQGELEHTMGGLKRVLRPGMVLLKNYISPSDQVKIVKICRILGLGPGGFYQPVFRGGRKMHLQMMCLGKNWDPKTRIYSSRRSTDHAKAPLIPEDWTKLVGRAIIDSHALIKQESKLSNVEVLPGMSPDICIINFYTNNGRLGVHQDQDESQRSISKGLPVVSFSIGNSADFLYGDDRDPCNAQKVLLESGDVLIFGGKSRLVYHGVPSIIPNSSPNFLVEEANLRPGRLNLTFRQY